MGSCSLPPWNMAVHWLIAQESCSCRGSGSWRWKPSLPRCGERLFSCEEHFQGGEGTTNFVLLSDSAETNTCSANSGRGLSIRARNCQRVSKYGKERIPRCPNQGSALFPPGCAEPQVVHAHRAVVVDTLPLETPKGQGFDSLTGKGWQCWHRDQPQSLAMMCLRGQAGFEHSHGQHEPFVFPS